MYDSRIDRVNPDRNLLDPELKHMVASSLIKARPAHHYALAVFRVGTASIVAGVLLLLLSAFGSSMWTAGTTPETLWSLLRLGFMGATWAIVGIVATLASGLFIKSRRAQ
jgi:hypothetical protein